MTPDQPDHPIPPSMGKPHLPDVTPVHNYIPSHAVLLERLKALRNHLIHTPRGENIDASKVVMQSAAGLNIHFLAFDPTHAATLRSELQQVAPGADPKMIRTLEELCASDESFPRRTPLLLDYWTHLMVLDAMLHFIQSLIDTNEKQSTKLERIAQILGSTVFAQVAALPKTNESSE